MPKTYNQTEPVALALDILGDRWTFLIVRDLLTGRTKFSALTDSLPGIPSNLLAERLKHLQRNGIVERVYYSEYPPRAEYVLTTKGHELAKIIASFAEWGNKHALPKGEAKLEFVHPDCGNPLSLQLYCPSCDQEVAPDRVTSRRDRRSRVSKAS
jgi:DNA-binding HxlR family transcriptional regulator